MTPTSNGMIYSPKHYSFYERDGNGPGVWVGNDIPKWNMAWLAMPELDLYLSTEPEPLQAINTKLFGAMTALASEEMASHFPTLRKALFQPPNEFLRVFTGLDLSKFENSVELPEGWRDTVIARAAGLFLTPVTAPGVGSIVHVDFRSRTRH